MSKAGFRLAEKILNYRLHVRLTDKYTEDMYLKSSKSSVHELQKYLNETEKYFKELESLQNLPHNSLQRRVFLASDNTTILKQVQIM